MYLNNCSNSRKCGKHGDLNTYHQIRLFGKKGSGHGMNKRKHSLQFGTLQKRLGSSQE